MPSRIKKIIYNFVALLIGCFVAIAMLAIVEFFLYLNDVAVKKQQKTEEHNLRDFIIYDPFLGSKNRPGFEGIHYSRIDGKEIYSCEYHIDENGRRITPVDTPEDRDQAALFFGCSLTFGYGVEQDETLPACFGRICKNYLPVNYAVGGYGPQHMWLQIQQPDFKKQVPRDKGVVIYGFIHHHLDRLMGERTLVSKWGWRLPWLDITETEVQYKGLMRDREAQKPFFIKGMKSLYTGCFVLEAMERFHSGRFILNRLNMLPYTEAEAVETLARLLADTKEKLTEILPGYKFVVFVYPLFSGIQSLKYYMHHYDIPCFNYDLRYHELNMDIDFKDYLYTDGPDQQWGHPQAIVYADTAKWLAEDLSSFCAEQTGKN